VIIDDFILSYCFHKTDRIGPSCYFTALNSIMNYYNQNHNIKESYLYFMLNGMNIKYLRNNYFGYDFQDKANFSFLDNYETVSLKENNRKYNLSYIKQLLLKKVPVMIYVETRVLDYHEIYTNNISRHHIIIIFGYENNLFHILDPHLRLNEVNYQHYVGTIDSDKILGAADYVMSLSNKSYQIADLELMDYFKKTIGSYLEGGNSLAEFKGVDAIAFYLNDCIDKIRLLNRDEFYNECLNINYNLKVNSSINVMQYLVIFLNEIGEKNNSQFNSILELSREFTKMSSKIVAAGYRFDAKSLEDALNATLKLTDKQNIVFNKMLREIG